MVRHEEGEKAISPLSVLLPSRQVVGPTLTCLHPQGPAHFLPCHQGQFYCVTQVRYSTCSSKNCSRGWGDSSPTLMTPLGPTLQPIAGGQGKMEGRGDMAGPALLHFHPRADSPITPAVCKACSPKDYNWLMMESALQRSCPQGQISHDAQMMGGASFAQLLEINMPPLGGSPDQGHLHGLWWPKGN